METSVEKDAVELELTEEASDMIRKMGHRMYLDPRGRSHQIEAAEAVAMGTIAAARVLEKHRS